MGSLCREDLGDLEDLGLVPESPVEGQAAEASTALHPTEGRETTDIPWFDSLVEGSKLGGRLKTTKGTRHSADGSTKIEFEIVEYNNDGSEVSTPTSGNGKRKLGDRDDADDSHMEGVSQ